MLPFRRFCLMFGGFECCFMVSSLLCCLRSCVGLLVHIIWHLYFHDVLICWAGTLGYGCLIVSLFELLVHMSFVVVSCGSLPLWLRMLRFCWLAGLGLKAGQEHAEPG